MLFRTGKKNTIMGRIIVPPKQIERSRPTILGMGFYPQRRTMWRKVRLWGLKMVDWK